MQSYYDLNLCILHDITLYMLLKTVLFWIFFKDFLLRTFAIWIWSFSGPQWELLALPVIVLSNKVIIIIIIIIIISMFPK